MSTERVINSAIKTTLVSNDEFSYAHLVKFERPFKSIGGKVLTDTTRYAYYTDGATDISFNDGSGLQTYKANRLIGVGQYSETTKARATSIGLTLAAEDLGATVQIPGTLSTVNASTGNATFTPTSTVLNGELVDFVEEGFKEGDLINFTEGSNVRTYIIVNFTANNSVINIARIGLGTTANPYVSAFVSSSTTATFTIQQDSIELNAALMERGITATNTANASPNFVNREVFVHKILINPETGVPIGGTSASILIFKGIIASVSIDEGPTGSKVKWSLTSHWGDFEEIKGRLTNDETHRALDATQRPQLDSTLRPEYAADLGFQHSETSLSAIATYKTQETRYRQKEKKRGGLAGLLGMKKSTQQEYQVDIQNEVDLNVHLKGKYLPVVYGVQRINGNPIFADTLNDNNKIVFTADAICEGEIHGLFNMYIDDMALICADDNDFDVRNVTSGTDKDSSQLQCYGKASRGNTLSGQVFSGTDTLSTQTAADKADAVERIRTTGKVASGVHYYHQNTTFIDMYGQAAPALVAGGAAGLEHGSVFNIEHPYSIEQQFMHGRPNQLASNMLVGPAEAAAGVGSVTVLGKGSSYESTPTVTFSAPTSGVTATGTAVMGSSSTDDANSVRGVRITNRGTGYTVAPTITFSGGGGNGARAASNLGGYKRQTDYWQGTLPYWSSNHRLLDTAYAAMKFTIDADATTLPEVEYVVKGKVLDCYNYDNTYRQNSGESANDDHTDFKEGDLVIVQTWNGSAYVNDNSGTNSNKFKIMDKWLFTTSRGTSHYKFRLDSTPNLGSVDGTPTKTKLRLKHASTNDFWHMLTWNHEIIGSTAFPDNWVAAGASSNITTPSGVITVSGISGANKTKLGATDPFIQFYAPEWYTTTPGDFIDLKYALLKGTWTGSGDSNVLTFANTTGYSGTFPSTIKLRNSVIFDCSSISTIANIATNATLTNSYTDSVNNTIFERGGTLHNITTGEFREIIDFNKDTNLVTIETPFLTPAFTNHNFKIDNTGADKRSLSNPALQTLDFITNAKYGRGLTISELGLQSFINSAKLCDARSDITIRLANSPSGVAVGDVFNITENGNSGGVHVASGTVAIGGIDIPNKTLTLTNVINKFAKRYSTYCDVKKGDIVYTDAGNYFRAADDIGLLPATVPTGTVGDLTIITGNVNLYKVSGTGSVSTLNMLKNALPIDYSLYDSDFIKYWRYYGWEEHHQREVTRHQTNFIIDTGKSVFSNINSLLSHFNGILAYENGKYVLSVETQEVAPIASLNSTQENINPYYIDATDVVGKISVVDNSQKNGKNTIKASLADPQLNFGTRSVSFFNSDFLKADRNVAKTASFPFTGITNYYNARINTEKELFQSRFSKEVSFELGPRAILLRAGQVISMTYKPFGWSSKLLRIENLNFKPNCNVSVKCREYDDSIYEITKQQALEISQQSSSQFSLAKPSKPIMSSVTNNKTGSMLLTWVNAPDFIEGSDSTEIYCSSSNSLASAVLLDTVDNSTTYMYNAAAAETKYFWIRHTRFSRGSTGNNNYMVKGDYNATSGTQGVSLAISAGAQSVKLLPSSHVVDYTKVGTETSTIQFTTIPFNISGLHFYEFFVGGSAVGSSLSSGNRGTINGISNVAYNAFVLPQSSEPGPDDAPVQVTVKIRAGASDGTVITQDTVSIFAVQDGQSAITGFLTNEAHTAAAASDGTGASLSGAGGTFKVFYGNTDITSNAKVTFSAASGTNITGSINAGSGVYTLSNFTNSATAGSVVFSTLVKGSLIGGADGGNDVTIARTYSIAKAKAGINGSGSSGSNAKTVNLTASDYSIVYDKDGATPNPSASTDILLTATAVNFVDPYFKFTGDGITDESSFTNGAVGAAQDTFTFQVPANIFTDPKTIRVGVSEKDDGASPTANDTSSSEVAFDSVSVFAVKPGGDGDDGYTVICTNEAHTFPSSSAGAISSFSGSGTDIEVFSGGTQLTAKTSSGNPGSGQFKVTAAATGITAGALSIVDSDTGVAGSIIRVANHSSMANATTIASIIYTINIENTTSVTKKQTFTKSKQGIAGLNAKVVVVSPSSAIMFEEAILDADPSVDEAVVFTPQNIDVRAETANTTANGAWSVSSGAVLTNVVNTHTSPSCRVTAANMVNGATVTYTLASADGGSADSTTLNLIDIHSSAVVVSLDNDSHVLPASASGAVSNYAGSGTTIKAFSGQIPLDFDGSGNTAGHFNVTVANIANITEGSISTGGSGSSRHAIIGNHSAAANGTDSYQMSYTITGKDADGVAFSIVKKQSITKSKTGDAGGTGAAGTNSATVTLYKRDTSGSSAPAVINNNTTYTFATGVLSGSLDGWTQAVPSGSAQFLWTCNAQAIGAQGATTDTVATGDWSTPVVTTDPQVARTMELTIFNPSTAASITKPTNTTSGTPLNFKTLVLSIGSGGSSGWTQSIPNVKPYFLSIVKVVEQSYEGAQNVTYTTAIRVGKFGDLDDEDFDFDIPDNGNKKIRYKFRNDFIERTLPDRYSNDSMSLDFDGVNPRLTKYGSTVVAATTPAALKNATIAINASTGVITGITGDGISIRNDKTTKANVGLPNVEDANLSTIRGGVTKANVGLANVEDANLATIRGGVTKANVGLANVEDANLATIRGGVTKANVGLSNVPNTDTTNAANISSGEISINRTPAAVRNSNTTKANVGLADVENANLSTIRAGVTKANVGLPNVEDANLSTIRAGVTKSNVGLPNVDNDSTATIRAVSAATSGTVAAWTISANKISNSKIEIDNANERILIKDS